MLDQKEGALFVVVRFLVSRVDVLYQLGDSSIGPKSGYGGRKGRKSEWDLKTLRKKPLKERRRAGGGGRRRRQCEVCFRHLEVKLPGIHLVGNSSLGDVSLQLLLLQFCSCSLISSDTDPPPPFNIHPPHTHRSMGLK